LFIGTRLGEVLKAMSFTKSVPKGLKLSKCQHGIGGKNSPISYIPESDPIQEALEKKKKVTYFKLALTSTGSVMSMAQWTSRTLEQFLLHVRAAIHACKQMELNVNLSKAQEAVTNAECDLEIAKETYAQVHCSEKKKATGSKGEAMLANSKPLALAKADHEKAAQAVAAAKLVITMEGAKTFELYANLLPNKARPAWDKIVKAQMSTSPWEDIYGVTHDETPVKTWDSFMECVMFHLQQVFKNDAGETLKYYITNTLRKPNRVPIHHFLVRVKQLNSYLDNLPCLYFSTSTNQAAKIIKPLDNSDLVTHLLHMCPAKWQT
jgi:hypothetical protein